MRTPSSSRTLAPFQTQKPFTKPSIQSPSSSPHQLSAALTHFASASQPSRLLFLSSLIPLLSPSEITFLETSFPPTSCLIFNRPFSLTNDFTLLLPHEISALIFSYLDTKSLSYASRVNKAWQKLLRDNIFWRKLCQRKKYLPVDERGKILSAVVSKIPISVGMIACGIPPWQKIYQWHYMTEKNWLSGRCRVSTIPNSPIGSSLHSYIDPETYLVASISLTTPSRIWNMQTQQTLTQFTGHTGFISAVKFNSEYILTGSVDRTIKVWDARSGRELKTLRGHTGEVVVVEFERNVAVSGAEDGRIMVWNILTGEPAGNLTGHRGAVCCLKFKSTGNDSVIISGGSDHTIRKWDLRSKRCLATLRGHHGDVFCVQFDRDRIVSGSADRTIKIWNRRTNVCSKTLEGHLAAVVCLQFDDSKIVSGSVDHTIRVWDLKTGRSLYTLRHHLSAIYYLRFNKTRLVSSSFDYSLVVWDFEYKDDGDEHRNLHGDSDDENLHAVSDMDVE